MNGYEAYRIYVSLKAHFRGGNYDFFRYGRLTPKVQTYETRKDRHFFDKLAKRHPLEENMVKFLLSQIQEDPNMWVGSMLGEEANQRYLEWRKRNERLSYQFGEDVKTIIKYASIHENFTPSAWGNMFVVSEKGNHPRILKLLMQKKIAPESFCVLDGMLNFTKSWDSKLQGDPVWEEMKARLNGYKSFVLHFSNMDNLKESVRRILSESAETNLTTD